MKPTATIGSLLGQKGNAVFSIAPEATVFDAIALMAQKGIGAVLVMREGRIAGILSERDYTRRVILQGRSSKETSVAEIMTSDVLTGDPEMTVEQAMRLMTERRIRHLPITEGGRLAGLVSLGDLVKWTITAQEETIGHLAKYITGTYPA
jgi:CBS domain-containing protein